jgi:hypothetical protein
MATPILHREWRQALLAAIVLKLAALAVLYYGWHFIPKPLYPADLWMTRPATSFGDNLVNFDGAWFVRLAALGYRRLAAGDYDLAVETKRLRVLDTLGYQQGLYPGDPERLDRGYGFRHWPLFPWLVRAFALIVRDYVTAAVLLANLGSFAFALLFYALVRLDADHATALKALLFASIHPGAYSLTAGFNESLFMALTAGAFLAGRKDRWLWAGLLAGLAGMTRILGEIILVPLLYEYLRRTCNPEAGPAPLSAVLGRENLRRAWQRFLIRPALLWLLLVPAGTGVVLLTFQQTAGSAWVFFGAHEANVHGHINWPWLMLMETYRKGAQVWLKELPLHAALLLVILASLRHLRKSYLLWMILFFLIQTANANHSYLRYQIQCLPLFIGLAEIGRRHPALEAGLIALSAGLFGVFATMFINGYWTA